MLRNFLCRTFLSFAILAVPHNQRGIGLMLMLRLWAQTNWDRVLYNPTKDPDEKDFELRGQINLSVGDNAPVQEYATFLFQQEDSRGAM